MILVNYASFMIGSIVNCPNCKKNTINIFILSKAILGGLVICTNCEYMKSCFENKGFLWSVVSEALIAIFVVAIFLLFSGIAPYFILASALSILLLNRYFVIIRCLSKK